MLLRLAYLGVTNALAMLRLLPMNDWAKDAEVLALRHQITVLERQLHGEKVRFDAHVRARLIWDDRKAPPLPRDQRDLADVVVDVLSKPRLSSSQSRQLYRVFFGR